MSVTKEIAKHLREIHFGGNWTESNLKDILADVDWHQATANVFGFHSIAVLVYHMNFFVAATLQVLEQGKLESKAKFSFDLPLMASQHSWSNLLQKTWSDAENLAVAIEHLPDTRLWEPFVEEKWGNYYRCLHGPIEHCHYHLGQIAMLKVILNKSSVN